MRRWLAVFFLILLTGVIIRQLQVEIDSFYSGQRGPYLQKLNANGVVIRWQTEQPLATSLQLQEQIVRHDIELTTRHRVELQNLQPATTYHYSINASKTDQYTFTTPPAADQQQTVRLWVLGDPGTNSQLHQAARTAGQQWLAKNARSNRPLLDIWLTTGDNAYTSGRNAEFQQAIFEPYQDWLSRFNLTAVMGNHDMRRRAYPRIFEFPAAAEQGGVASGSQYYYSMDQGPLHLIVLDSAWSLLNDRTAMLEWLEQDLQANTRPWLMAVFHHAPYSKGSHDSDDDWGSDRRIGMVRQYILPLLERHNVDLVVAGHSHVYERSHLLDGHYGKSNTFTDEMIVSPSHAIVDNFSKQPDCQHNCGAIYQVLGSTAELRPGALDHPAMPVGLNQSGTLIIDIDAGCLSSRFLNTKGQLADQFIISKQPITSCFQGTIAPRDLNHD